MAGFYPDVPAPRMAYDRDGTVAFSINTASVTVGEWSAGAMLTVNDESSSEYYVGGDNNGLARIGAVLIFPQLRDIAAYNIVARFDSGTVGVLYTSPNTTNGIDGTWTSHGNWTNKSFDKASLRSPITFTASGVKAIRFQAGNGSFTQRYYIQSLHLFGGLSSGETPDRLRIWHPTLDEPLDDNNSVDGAYLDWGDVARSTTQDRTFRIKNNSATLTANSIVLSPELLSDTAPTVVSQMTLSDGGAFTDSLDIGSLAPGAISPIITLRRTIASNATLSLWTGRININPGNWT